MSSTSLTKDEELIREAKERFKMAREWEGEFNNLFTDDLKFVRADPDNGYQWPDTLRNSRQSDRKPCLTINKTRQQCLMIINDIKESLPAIKIRAVGGEASYDSAQVYEGMARHIQYQSNASDAYKTATEFQVWTGIGYWRVVTEYADEDSFDQEIFIRRIRNPQSVTLDPNIKEVDGSDAKWGFVHDDVPRKEFNRKYPKYKDKVGSGTISGSDEWCNLDTVRVAEYYYTEYVTDELIAMPVPDGVGGVQITTIRKSVLMEQNPDLGKMVLADKGIQRRPIETPSIKWCKIAGDAIVERSDWVGTTIPIVRIVGEECVIDGKLDRKGHVRNIKDPQRMYNYWSSSATEHVALQTKTPYIADDRSIEGYETIWETANTENHAVLPYKSADQNGNPIPPPQRAEAPVMSAGYMQGMQIAAEEMKMASGQNDALMGAPSNEIAGVAIKRRAKQGETSTSHFRDGLATGIRYTGKILIDIIPKVYDTPRVVRILAEDGSDDTVKIDPQQNGPMVEQEKPGGEGVERIFNPGAGKYEVVADTGPSYATKREEAFAAMSDLAAQNPSFLGLAGDLYMLSADFPLADELAERFKRSIPANILGEGPSPELQQATDTIKNLQAQLASAMDLSASKEKEADDKAKQTEIKSYQAMTDRLDKLLTHIENTGALPDIGIIEAQTMMAAAGQPTPIDAQPANDTAMLPPPDMSQGMQPPGTLPIQ
jgi:hypothetical protein